MRSGDFQKAETKLSQARSLLDDLAEGGFAADFVLSGEADYLACRGEWPAAARIHRAQVAAARKRNDEWWLAHVRYGLGWVVLEPLVMGLDEGAGEWEEAEEALVEAIELNDRRNHPRRALARLMLGTLHVSQRRLEDGRRLLAEAQEKTPEPMPGWLEADAQVLQAFIARAEGRWAKALDAIEASAATHERLGHRWYWARTLLDWAEVLVARGEPGDREWARELLRQSQAAFEEMGAPRYAAVAAERLEALAAGEEG
jgi:tetratricopeptide (TPR) repeat protein